jgi:hypothetical protein
MRLIDKLIRIWFFARPLVLGAARVQEDWFSLSFIAPPTCHTWRRGQQAVFAELLAVFANRRVVGGWWRLSTNCRSSITAITPIGPWQTGQLSGSTCQTRRISFLVVGRACGVNGGSIEAPGSE